jgi:hypothetical protein
MSTIRFIQREPNSRVEATRLDANQTEPGVARPDVQHGGRARKSSIRILSVGSGSAKAKSHGATEKAVRPSTIVAALVAVGCFVWVMHDVFSTDSRGSLRLSSYNSQLTDLKKSYAQYFAQCNTPTRTAAQCMVSGNALPSPQMVSFRLNLVVFYRNTGEKVRARSEANDLLLSFPADPRNPLLGPLTQLNVSR